MKDVFLFLAVLALSSIGSAHVNPGACQYDWKFLNGTVDITSNNNGVDTRETCASEIMIQDTSPCDKMNPSLGVTTYFHCASGEFQPISGAFSIRGNELWSNQTTGGAQAKFGTYTTDNIQFYLGCESMEIGNLSSHSAVDFSYAARCEHSPVVVLKTASGRFAY